MDGRNRRGRGPRLHLRSGIEQPLLSALVHDEYAAEGMALVAPAEGGDVRLYRAWLSRERADALLEHVRATTTWRRERRKMYDRYVDVPREQAWRGDAHDEPFTPELRAIRDELVAMLGVRFSHVLLNRYRNGADSVAWHNDREVETIVAPTIASLTLGTTRAFDLRSKAERSAVVSVEVEHGDLIVMRGETQRGWEHRIAKDARVTGERINLTFRQQPE